VKLIAKVLVVILNLFPVGNAFAHGDHAAQHGGVMGRGDDSIVVEFAVEKGTLIVYVEDDSGNPLAKEGVTGTLTVAPPQGLPQQVKLIRVSDRTFAAPDAKPRPGDRMRARIKIANGEEIESVGLFPK
jgi:hypothetical protein